MKYMGSKNRIAKHILPLILKDRKEGQWYVEPFCGGCNLIDKVTGNRIANDIHFELIAMFKALQEGWLPPTVVSESHYQDIKNNTLEVKQIYGDKFAAVRGAVGFSYSYAAKWFGGYCRGYTSNGEERNYILEGYRNIVKQVPSILNIIFINTTYNKILLPNNCIIYCDPPYRNTTKYKDNLDYEQFYIWCRDMKEAGHTVFVSEYNMPDDFTCIWSKEQVSSLTRDTGSKTAIEKLFTLN